MVAHARDAIEVVRAYTRRWRIEEFHRTWKAGACGIEGTRLRAYDHIQRWAIITASVAARIEQLTKTTGDAILITQRTADRMTRRDGLIDRGSHALKGKSDAVRVFGLAP
mgnify:CR=1 FL=1